MTWLSWISWCWPHECSAMADWGDLTVMGFWQAAVLGLIGSLLVGGLKLHRRMIELLAEKIEEMGDQIETLRGGTSDRRTAADLAAEILGTDENDRPALRVVAGKDHVADDDDPTMH